MRAQPECQRVEADRENGAVLVDAFHFDRSGSRLEDLARVAPSRLRYAQLCDVAGPRPADMAEILRQARNERRFPGDGDCDLRGCCAVCRLTFHEPGDPHLQLLEQASAAWTGRRWRGQNPGIARL
jgi:hypothetical protein